MSRPAAWPPARYRAEVERLARWERLDLIAELIDAYSSGGEWTPPRLLDLLAAPAGDGLSTSERASCWKPASN